MQNTGREHRKNDRFILCLDGGGIRGITSTVVLKKAGEILREKGFEGNFAEAFDLIAGTSTGGLITAGLTCPSLLSSENGMELASLEDLHKIYIQYGPRIFGSQLPFSFLNALRDKYSPDNLETLLKYWFRSARLSDCKVPTLIMAYDSTRAKPLPMTDRDGLDILTWEACRSTSAAPTYFPPYNKDGNMLVDGGVIANNPSLYAYRYAKTLYPDCGRFHILSISTCAAMYRYGHQSSHGIASWLGSIHKVYANGQMQTADEIMQCLSDVEYTRIYTELEDGIEMDDTSEKTMHNLEQIGEELAQQFKTELDVYFDTMVQKSQPQPGPLPEPAPEPVQKKKRGFFGRLFGRKG